MINKFILLIIFSFISLSGFSETSWEFVKVKDEYFLQAPNGTNHNVHFESGKPEVTKIEKINESYSKVVYYAGEAGTSQIVKIYRAAVFKNQNFKYIGNYPSHYEGIANIQQPQWVVSESQLIIKDENEDIQVSIALK
jgi:hypothetical protein